MKRLHWIDRLDFAVLIGIVCAVVLGNIAVFGQECELVRNDVVRLHILANSDDDFDQAIKLKVRDRILAEVGQVFAAPQTKQDAKLVAAAHLEEIKQVAERVLAEQNLSFPVTAELCNMYFNTRQYDDLSLPAGYYDAVRVTIGAGAGKNWWCVMYPPLCVPTALEENSVELQEIKELGETPMFVPKLAVVELVEGLFQ